MPPRQPFSDLAAAKGRAHGRVVLIYLIRHAHALDDGDDEVRPLSPKGRKQIRQVAAFFRRNGLLAAKEFWHSPLVRARDTAELLAQRLKGRVRLVEVAGLRPDDNPARMAKRLRATRRPVAVVGHEPHLSALASLLVCGRAAPPLFVVRKCAVLALERTRRRWVVRWLVSPEILSREKNAKRPKAKKAPRSKPKV